jgi:hypothetical protein
MYAMGGRRSRGHGPFSPAPLRGARPASRCIDELFYFADEARTPGRVEPALAAQRAKQALEAPALDGADRVG